VLAVALEGERSAKPLWRQGRVRRPVTVWRYGLFAVSAASDTPGRGRAGGAERLAHQIRRAALQSGGRAHPEAKAHHQSHAFPSELRGSAAPKL
jgi:hypothetical protein